VSSSRRAEKTAKSTLRFTQLRSPAKIALARISGRDPTLWRALEEEYVFKTVDALDAPSAASLKLKLDTVA
jgi:hypothetical protein